MTRDCPHCQDSAEQCQRCDRELGVRDLEGHEGRGGLYRILNAEGGQNHE